jgi:hypothetical protein
MDWRLLLEAYRVTIVYNCTPFFDGSDVAAFGTVYFGVANEDPLTDPKNPTTIAGVWLPSSITLTSAGMMPYSVVIDSTYSILVHNADGDEILSQDVISLPDMSVNYLLADDSVYYDKITGLPLDDQTVYYGEAYKDPRDNPAAITDEVDLSIEVVDGDGVVQFSSSVVANTFPIPAGIPSDAIPFGINEDFWAVQSTSPGVTVNYSTPRYNSVTGEYSGGWVAEHAPGAWQWTIYSIGSWFVNLSARNVYMLWSVRQSLGGSSLAISVSSKNDPVFSSEYEFPSSIGVHQYTRSGAITVVNADPWVIGLSMINLVDQSSIVRLYYN